jgi:heme A synthase
LGWYMVKSGLDHRILEKGEVPRVSQYRLAAHLGAALLFFMGTLRLGLSAKKDRQWAAGGKVNGVGDAFISLLQDPRIKRFKWVSAALLALAFTTAISGMFQFDLLSFNFNTRDRRIRRWFGCWSGIQRVPVHGQWSNATCGRNVFKGLLAANGRRRYLVEKPL